MLYYFTRSIIELSLRGFFRNIDILDRQNILKKGPVIYVVNHPSALMDPLMVSITVRQKLHFLAAAEYCGTGGLKSWLLKDQFNMIPVYRPNLYEGQEVDNDSMFRHCYERLEKGGSILIFPEGNSVTENRLRNLKTGVVRILLGARRKSPGIDVKIVPLGLNYEDHHRFHSDVLIKIGAPMSYTDFPIKESDTEEEKVKKITGFIEARLQEQILHIEDPELDPVFSHIDDVFKQEMVKTSHKDQSLAARFRIQKDIIHAISHFKKASNQNSDEIKSLLTSYFKKCKALGLRQSIHRSNTRMEKVLRSLKLFLLTPFFIAGALICAGPYFLTKRIYKKTYLPRLQSQDHSKPISPAFAGSIAFAIGTLLFLFWFLLLSITFGLFTSWWMGVFFFFGSYFLGQISLRATSLGFEVLQGFRQQKIVRKYPNETAEIIEMRKALLESLGEYQKSYLAEKELVRS
ncbi:MAG: glycerol-3-phosphate O-acyltransferase/dihydroxyacetone phosphate acyltransferase [Cyclobacteriaceae bacterium]|jgi:glycerol-3-phosphate O-acyltransferase/dihydroxyacetone phosphate acyltransferase